MHFKSPRPCCEWRRGPNDVLYDETDGKHYCAACWQTWLQSKENARFENASVRSKPASSAVSLSPDAARDSREEVLDGIVHTDGSLYLVDPKRNVVYSTERTEDGDLISVGVLQHGKISLFQGRDCKLELPFDTDPADHCETPYVAYEDLAPFLSELARLMNKSKKELKIWDPYYCAGSVRKHFAALGFLSVHNVCEDFYKILDSNQLPNYDCVVTNPPYSSTSRDHVAELLKFLTTQTKPWFVVQPNFVYTKPFWEELNGSSKNCPRPFFLTPATPRKYIYQTPQGARNVKSQQLRTSPFVSMWYCWAGKEYTSSLYRWAANAS